MADDRNTGASASNSTGAPKSGAQEVKTASEAINARLDAGVPCSAGFSRYGEDELRLVLPRYADHPRVEVTVRGGTATAKIA